MQLIREESEICGDKKNVNQFCIFNYNVSQFYQYWKNFFLKNFYIGVKDICRPHTTVTREGIPVQINLENNWISIIDGSPVQVAIWLAHTFRFTCAGKSADVNPSDTR